MPAYFEFVPLDGGQGKPQDRRRDLIRRHCMRKKNKRDNSRRTQRQVRLSTRNRHNPQGDALLAAMPSDVAFSLQTFPQTEKSRNQAIVERQNAWKSSPRLIMSWTTSHWQHPHPLLLGSSASPFGMCLQNCSHGPMRDCTLFPRYSVSRRNIF